MTRYLEIKPGSISETIKRLSDDYQAIFKKELEKTGKGIGSMTPDEKKAFFNKIDKMHNAKNEANEPVKSDDSKTTLVAAPGNKEKVIRIPKEKLADYKAKGYVEAESYIPEAKKVKEEELTAGQKKLPPALQKAIEKKDKKEEVEINEITDEEEKNYARQITSLSNDKVMARINKKGDAAIAAIQSKIDGVKSERDKKRAQKNEEVKMKDDPCWKDYKMVGMKKKNGKDVPNCVPKEEVEIKEGGMKEIDTNKKELERLSTRLSQLRDRKNANAGGDTTDVEKQIKQTQMSVIDVKKRLSATKKEEVETVEEAAGPDRLTNLNDKISKLQVNLSKLDKSKPESKTKEAIIKSDLVTAKLRLQDLMQKRNAETKQESVNEAKKNYKSMKKSLKKEQDKEVNTKRTLTDKPITKVDVDPKIKG